MDLVSLGGRGHGAAGAEPAVAPAGPPDLADADALSRPLRYWIPTIQPGLNCHPSYACWFTREKLRPFLRFYDWPVEDGIELVIFGPTPPNRDAPQGCGTGESSGFAWANGGGSIGLAQVHADAHREKVERVVGVKNLTHEEAVLALSYPDINLAVAYLVYVESGGRTFLPWSCRP